jgi:hypothetical protein
MSAARLSRLFGLAAAMKLPCPVRENFLFGADAAFYTQCIASTIELQRAAKRVFQHAGLTCDATVVMWKSTLPAPARTDRDGHTWFLEIDAKIKNDAHALGATLAREAARAILATHDEPRLRTPSPLDTELAALLLGFGPVLIAATSSLRDRSISVHTVGGPLSPDEIRSLHARVCASLRISLARSIDLPLASTGLRFQLVIAWIIARVLAARRPLVFAPIEPHVIIRCFCARRLRVPTGSLGKTTCPACRRKRPFDGRACRTALAA